MSSRVLLSITFSTLLLMFVITSAVQVVDGHGGAGGPGHQRIRDHICIEIFCTGEEIKKEEKKFCFLYWCF